MIKYLDEFFDKFKKVSEFKSLEIIIFSDHDSRIDPTQIENNVLYVHKKIGSVNSNIISDKISLNQLFYDLNFN